MRFHHVVIEAIGYLLPPHRVTSAELEERLAPLYQRLSLPAGRLEMMTGIAERRFWDAELLPSQASAWVGQLALQAADRPACQIGALIHASVCRDYLEPATACRVHYLLGLPPQCLIYDVSNACLGMLNGMLQIANMIELGQIEAGLVVGTESSRALVEATLETLLQGPHDRQSIKPLLASLTIGSAACAILLGRRSDSRAGAALEVAVWRACTQHHELCRSTRDEAVADGMYPLMETDAERLLQAGVIAGQEAFAQLKDELTLAERTLTRTVCHQVGTAHRRSILDALQLDPVDDFITYPWLGNTGSAALPITLALAARQSFLRSGDYVGLLGIGSGINVLMLTLAWDRVAVCGFDLAESDEQSAFQIQLQCAGQSTGQTTPARMGRDSQFS